MPVQSSNVWQIRGRTLLLDRPLIMGVLNLTPDSFSDGGNYKDIQHACDRALEMLAEGARIIDLGGESTRPGSATVTAAQEIERVAPVMEALMKEVPGAIISIDTSKAEVARTAARLGASVINDVSAGTLDPVIKTVAAEYGCGFIAMHMKGVPRTMQENPQYADAVSEIAEYLAGRVDALETAGMARESVVVDPGIGFGKLLSHNIELFKGVRAIREVTGRPVLIGASRKSMLGAITGKPVKLRLASSIAAALAAVNFGAAILRVHDVAETADALKVWQEIVI